MTKSAFATRADEAGGEFAAAAFTLQAAHEGKLTSAYANATFVNYASFVRNLDQDLTKASGAPDAATLSQLVVLSRQAQEAVTQPCLADSCNWQQQVVVLRETSKALRSAAETS